MSLKMTGTGFGGGIWTPRVAGLQNLSTFSWSMWVKLPWATPTYSLPAFFFSGFGADDDPINNNPYLTFLEFTTGNNLKAGFVNASATSRTITTSVTPTLTDWTNIVYTCKSGEQKLYINAVEVASGTVSGEATESVDVGLWLFVDAPTEDIRKFQDLAVWDSHYLTQLEVIQLAGRYKSPEDLSADHWWPMDGSGTFDVADVTDSIGSLDFSGIGGNDATHADIEWDDADNIPDLIPSSEGVPTMTDSSPLMVIGFPFFGDPVQGTTADGTIGNVVYPVDADSGRPRGITFIANKSQSEGDLTVYVSAPYGSYTAPDASLVGAVKAYIVELDAGYMIVEGDTNDYGIASPRCVDGAMVGTLVLDTIHGSSEYWFEFVGTATLERGKTYGVFFSNELDTSPASNLAFPVGARSRLCTEEPKYEASPVKSGCNQYHRLTTYIYHDTSEGWTNAIGGKATSPHMAPIVVKYDDGTCDGMPFSVYSSNTLVAAEEIGLQLCFDSDVYLSGVGFPDEIVTLVTAAKVYKNNTLVETVTLDPDENQRYAPFYPLLLEAGATYHIVLVFSSDPTLPVIAEAFTIADLEACWPTINGVQWGCGYKDTADPTFSVSQRAMPLMAVYIASEEPLSVANWPVTNIGVQEL